MDYLVGEEVSGANSLARKARYATPRFAGYFTTRLIFLILAWMAYQLIGWVGALLAAAAWAAWKSWRDVHPVNPGMFCACASQCSGCAEHGAWLHRMREIGYIEPEIYSRDCCSH